MSTHNIGFYEEISKIISIRIIIKYHQVLSLSVLQSESATNAGSNE